MSEIKILLSMKSPPASKPPAPAKNSVQEKHEECCKKPSVEERVKHALELIDSGYKSDIQWIMINKLYKQLCEMKKPSERALNIKKMIEPVLAKFGYHKVAEE